MAGRTASSLRESILKKSNVPTQKLYVSEWGCTVVIYGLTARQRDDFEERIQIKLKNGKRDINFKNLRANLVQMCTYDEEGNQIFTEKDISAIGELSSKVVSKIANVVQELSGMTAEDMEEIVGNSEQIPEENSSLN